MKVNSVINLYDGVIERLEKAQQQALSKTVESLHTDVLQEQVMPRDSGTLQNESTFVDLTKLADGKASLVTSTPYARRLYYHPEYHFQKEENPNAKGKWLEDYISGDKKEFITEEYKRFFKEESGV